MPYPDTSAYYIYQKIFVVVSDILSCSKDERRFGNSTILEKQTPRRRFTVSAEAQVALNFRSIQLRPAHSITWQLPLATRGVVCGSTFPIR